MLNIRAASQLDIPALLGLQEASYPTLSKVSAWRKDHLVRHQLAFPQGQLVAELDGRIVGFSASFIARSEEALRPHTFRDVTERGTFARHDPDGDTLYGAEIVVHPDHRAKGVGRRLYAARFELARALGLRYFMAGGRVPGYQDVSSTTSIEEYVRSVVNGLRVDRVLTPQLRNGLRVVGVLPNYLNDPRSGNYATLLVWQNPDHAEARLPTMAAPPVAHGAEAPSTRAL